MLELTIHASENMRVSPTEMDTALFETIRVSEGQPIFLDRHLNRMAVGLLFMKTESLPPAESVRTAIIRSLALTGTVGGAIKLMAAGPLLHVLPRKAAPVPAAVVIGISKSVLRQSASPLAKLKPVARSWSDALRAEAAQTGAFDCIALNEHENLTEGGRTNLFLVQSGEIMTPPLADGCLPGISRSIVLETGKVMEQPLKPKDLAQCEAAFLTNALIGAVPVSKVLGMGRKNLHHPLILEVKREITRAVVEDLRLFS
ncbi:MAG: aminotransferase class IV [Acidobacteria bacterium]|nr:aminotransferase class IV [Acidobacteriota bacterium]